MFMRRIFTTQERLCFEEDANDEEERNVGCFV